MRILIAEDDLTSRMMLTAILKKWGYEPVAVEDGLKAWEIMRQAKAPDLALLDWEMPGMSGLEVCRKIREKKLPNPPYLIILTAKSEKTDIVKGLDAGANDFISKPFDNNELQARINVGKRMAQLQSELHDAKDALAYEAMHDTLTGAFNRRAIMGALENEIARSQRKLSTLSIGMCDIDYFKKVNDTYGHPAGDDVLIGFVKTIQKNLRKYDFVGRYGGEEFLVIAPESVESSVEILYERLKNNVSNLKTNTKSGEIKITVSIGVARFEKDSTVESMLAEADKALYEAKDMGRNQIVYASDLKNNI